MQPLSLLLSIAATVMVLEGLQSPLQAQPGRDRANQIVLLILSPEGFEQSDIRIPHGRTMIKIENRTFSEDVAFQLDQESGPRLRSVALNKGKRSAREIVELAPGSYIVSVPGQARWRCRLRVVAR